MSIHRLPSSLKRLTTEFLEIKRETRSSFSRSDFKQRCAQYSKFIKSCKIRESHILYESYWGRGMVDNPYAIFKYLLAHPECGAFQHIWVVADDVVLARLKNEYGHCGNVKFVIHNSNDYLKELASAKYLINNVTFPSYFLKREGQVYINTWHGTPLKGMGFDTPDGNTATSNSIRNFLHADYLISANEVMTNMYLSSYKLEGIMPGSILEMGYPRNDLLFSTAREDAIQKLISIGIDIDPNKRIILYAPTWRKGTSTHAKADADQLFEVKECLENAAGQDYQVLIKPHQYVYQALKDQTQYAKSLIPSYYDANEILSITDVLVSDYSSIFFDFLALDRPIVFYVPDIGEYIRDRGFTLDINQMPGPTCNTLDSVAEVIANLSKADTPYSAMRKEMRSEICGYDDGHVTQRLVSQVFLHRDNGLKEIKTITSKKKLLIYSGVFLENGITRSFLSLMNSIDYSEWDVTAYITVLGKNAEMKRKVNEDLNDQVRAIVRVGTFLNTPHEETWREFISRRPIAKAPWKSLFPWDIFKLEFRRAFGDAQFDYIIDFNGYSPVFVPMLLAGAAQKRAIWMHNDMLAEKNKVVNGTMPHKVNLGLITSLYPKFDRIVSCGPSVMEVNRANFASQDTFDAFGYARNTFNILRFKKALSGEDIISVDGREHYVLWSRQLNPDCYRLSYIELPGSEHINFITMGRLSPEKNHAALIRAFSQLSSEYPDARLFIIGDGPLRSDLESLIEKKGLTGRVFLTGNISNPYAFMKRSNCFVLPSLHEGQPLALLEARACGLPIIVSNFSTLKDSLIPDGQLVIGHDETSICEGMHAFIQGKVPTVPFDIDKYNEKAYTEFVEAIL